METAQQRFFEALEPLAAKHEHEVVQEPAWANTGRVALVRAGTFDTTVAFTYSFSKGHNVFESEQPFFSTEAGSNPRMDIAREVAELQRVLDAIDAALSS